MVKENLIKALARLGPNGEYWTRRKLMSSYNWRGQEVTGRPCFCMAGSLMPDNGPLVMAYLATPELYALARAITELKYSDSTEFAEVSLQVTDFNDYVAKDFEDVHRVFKRAIENSW